METVLKFDSLEINELFLLKYVSPPKVFGVFDMDVTGWEAWQQATVRQEYHSPCRIKLVFVRFLSFIFVGVDV